MTYDKLSDNAKKLVDRLRLDPIHPNQKAYLLATVKHETASTYAPINERGSDSYLSKYWTNTRLRKWLGNITATDAQRYKGRGFVQITGRGLYARAAKVLGVDLVGKPELANDWENAYKIMLVFSTNGWFTGVSLKNYINTKGTDYFNARRVINGVDKAALIAGYAKEFEELFNQ